MQGTRGHAGGAAQDFSTAASLEAFNDVSEAVESGAGLPAVTRAAARALRASVIVIDSSATVLAAACRSSEDERAMLAGTSGAEGVELRVADDRVGELRFRPSGAAAPPPAVLRMVANLIAYEVQRSRAPERATEAAVGDFLSDLLARRITDRENIVARAEELGCDLSGGATVLVARARPRQPEEGDWRARVLAAAARGARAVERRSLAAFVDPGLPRPAPDGGAPLSPARGKVAPTALEREVAIAVPGEGPEPGRRAAEAVRRELEAALEGYLLVVGRSRPAADPADLHRAGWEALLAANVAEARGLGSLSFEETGAYRLLLHAMSEDPAELQRFHEETIAPLVRYDDQYETELVRTLDSFLDADGNVARTAEKLFTHRHTIRYRLDRVRELTGLDVGSSEGRERLSLGLKAMRVLGIVSPGGPAREPGAGAGRVPREEKDR